jgi:NAD-dependent dihydropyrimidine dehydrogenase PreA subunit
MKLLIKVDYNPGDTGKFIDVDEDKCTGCGDCAKLCTMDVWKQEGDIFRPARLDQCAECGACWNVCEADAVLFGEPKGGTGVKFSYG